MARHLILLLLVALGPVANAGDPQAVSASFTLLSGWQSHPLMPVTLRYEAGHCVLNGVLYRGSYDHGSEKTSDGRSATRFVKIDSFEVKQVLGYESGRVATTSEMVLPESVQFPKVTFYVPEADAQVFIVRYAEQALHGIKLEDFRFGCSK